MSMRPILSWIDRLLSGVESIAIVVFTIIALVLGGMQVLLRYAFNTGFETSEALFVLATAAGMMFAGSRAVRDDKHVRFELLPLLLPARPIAVLRFLAHLLSLALCGYFAWCGWTYVQFVNEMETVSPETGLPDWLVYTLVPITMAMFAARYVIRIIRALRGEDVVALHGTGPDAQIPDPIELGGRT
jgi:C4-dicarboxylate transporter DctQ subunit